MLRCVQRGTRGSGITVNPERVRDARLAAGLTMADVAGNQVSRTFIHQVEHGTSRPSPDVLKLIARKTGKPLSFFTSPGSDERMTRQMLATDLLRLAGRIRRFGDTADLGALQKQSLRLLENSLRQGAVLARNL